MLPFPLPVLSRVLRAAVGPTFNAITVDGDTSTNDTVALLANGQSGVRSITGGANYQKLLRGARTWYANRWRWRSWRDGEGAQRVIEIEVRGASSDRGANQIARTIANSPLVKTALAGADPNWGRILAAAGRSGVKFEFRARGHLAGRHRGLPRRPRVSVRRDRRARKDAREICPHRSRSACGGRKGAYVDLRFHQGIHSHQRQLSHLTFTCGPNFGVLSSSAKFARLFFAGPLWPASPDPTL